MESPRWSGKLREVLDLFRQNRHFCGGASHVKKHTDFYKK